MPEEVENKDIHLEHLVDKLTEDFNDRVKSESDPSYLLLKGHLLIENILQETLAVFDCQKTGRIDRISFHEKTNFLKNLQEYKDEIKGVSPLLYSLNEVRNDLAHNLDFKISESDVNKIGINLGSKYIIKKYEIGHKNVKEILLFCLNEIVYLLGFIIYSKMKQIKKHSA